jgi:hypothetical protein
VAESSLFSVGDRVAFLNGIGYDPEWFFGRVTEVAQRSCCLACRIRWDDGYTDQPGSIEEWYTSGELRHAEEIEASV